MSLDTLFFVSGLPRSGSTLLMNILGQNPANYVTPTNDVIDLVIQIRNSWKKFEGFRAQNQESLVVRVKSAMVGVLAGFYAPEIASGKIIFDKSRGWPAYIELMEEILERKIKIIVTTRSVPDIVASFEKKRRVSQMTLVDPPLGPSYFEMQILQGRVSQLLSPSAVLGVSINRVRDAELRGFSDRLIKVAYSDLVNNPGSTMERLHRQLGLPAFTYDFENVQQITYEDDSDRGMDLHTIRPRVEPEKGPAWINVLPQAMAKRLSSEYPDFE